MASALRQAQPGAQTHFAGQWVVQGTKSSGRGSSVEPLPSLSDGLYCAAATATAACFTQSSGLDRQVDY
ncbi:hypothetical protein ABBQ38_013871 [Trebouxia sp. C0009 RCD-2024]